jgi:glyceraldehyde 3-phosphate dehydrogenase
MSKVKLAINGFGRIGRNAFKIAFSHRDHCEIVGINDLSDNATLAYLLKHDTAYGAYQHDISFDDQSITIDGVRIPMYAEKDPTQLPWGQLKVDVVLECTGRFLDKQSAGAHLTAGARKVVISAPSKGDDPAPTHVIGVNPSDGSEPIINNASCTTNCITPIMAVLEEAFGIEMAMMSTVHSYTQDQMLQDGPHKDPRRARAAGQNIVPTSTGAAIATTESIASLKGKFDGISFRVPTLVVSLSDVTAVLKKKVTVDEVNEVLRHASKHHYKGIIGVTDEELVSSDFKGDPHSCIVDLPSTMVVNGTMLKVVAWYDNEWGYSNRLVEQAIRHGHR